MQPKFLSTHRLSPFLLAVLSAGLPLLGTSDLNAAETISLNFWRTGAGTVSRDTWMPLLTLGPNDSAGVGDWQTTGWQNYELPWAPTQPQAPRTLTGTEGSTATFVLKDVRNGGPYIWNPPRATLLGNAHANMMDGHVNSTEDPGDESNVFQIEITDIPFPVFDVVFYLGANQAQFGDGTGKAVINNGPVFDFTLLPGAFDGTYTEITTASPSGNYWVLKGLGGPTFTAKIWGNGFNHLGPTGMQIRESSEARQPLEIAEVTRDPATDQVTLTWKSNPGDFYGLFWSEDLITFHGGINPAVEANPDSTRTTFGPFPNPKAGAENLFFRVGPPDLIDPTLKRVWGNGTTINLTFSEAMNAAAITNPANYVITGSGGGAIPIASIEPGATPDTVVIITNGPLGLNADYTVTTTNLTDLAGRSLGGSPQGNFRTWDDNPNGVKVFILTGQSNMQGHGRNEEGLGGVNGAIGSLRYQTVNDPAKYGRLVDENNQWIAREDVKVFYRRSDLTGSGDIKKGNLLPEFGVSNAQLGPEYGFGWAVGEALDQPVLIIKTAWGGKSLFADFRSPTAVAKRGGEVGNYYLGLFDYAHQVLDQLGTEFPEWDGLGYQIAGFGWHQGWNDGDSDFTANQYEANLADFITDIRAEFGKATLPFSVANTGIGGVSTTGRRLTILEGQLAVADPARYPDFAGNVFAADTRPFWRQSSVSPRDQGFHWNQNGETYYLIGEAMGLGMIQLLEE